MAAIAIATGGAAILGMANINNLIGAAKGGKVITDTPLIQCNLAYSYGKKLPEHLKELDEQMKVWIGVTMKMLGELKEAKDRTWENVIYTFTQNPVLEPMDDKTVYRTDSLTFDEEAVLTHPGDVDPEKKKQAETFINKIIADKDVINDLSFDPSVYASMIASSGVAVKDLATLFYGNERLERNVVDVGVLRFPDIDNPYFKVYRVSLHAWASCERIMFIETNRNGINIEFQSKRFQPRETVLRKLSDETAEKAASFVDDMF